MQSLNIADAGFGYIFRCIGLYYEGNIYFLLYLLSLVFLSLASKKGEHRMRDIFLPQFILMAVTVYNPVFPVALNTFFDVNKEYYRFLWMSPVIICIAAAGTLIITGCKGAVRQIVTCVFILCLLIAGGSFLYKGGYIASPTIYHVPTEIPEIADIIHEDSDEEFPRAMLEFDYQMQIRQYDAGILLSCGREDYMRALAGEVTMDSALEEHNYIDRLLAVVALGIKLPGDRFRSALKHTDTSYVVVSSKGGMVPYLLDAGLVIAGETANHTVFRYDIEEPEEFELPDYSEVWRLHPKWFDIFM